MEIFKPVKGFEGYYEVSNKGRVKSLPRYTVDRQLVGRFLKPYKNKLGYLTCVLCKDASIHPQLIHRLVGGAFVKRPNGKDFINHKNSNRADNRAENLEWCTTLENVHHKIYVAGHHQRGDRHPRVKLKESEVLSIHRKYKNGSHTYQSLGDEYGVLDTTIFKIIRRLTWKHLNID